MLVQVQMIYRNISHLFDYITALHFLFLVSYIILLMHVFSFQLIFVIIQHYHCIVCCMCMLNVFLCMIDCMDDQNDCI